MHVFSCKCESPTNSGQEYSTLLAKDVTGWEKKKNKKSES
jgi:hypothetical protein